MKKNKDFSRVHKAFALSSIIGAMLMAHTNGNPKLVTLRIQVDKAMKVYAYKFGSKNYYMMTDEVKGIWFRLADRHNSTLDEDELSLFIEMVLSLAPKVDMKSFLGMYFTTCNHIADSKKSAVMASVMELDEELNALCRTKQTQTREGLGLLVVKPVKLKRVTTKTKVVSKQQVKHNKEVAEHKDRKKRISSFLRERIAAIKKDKQ